MNRNVLTYGMTLYVEDIGKAFHTLADWGLALGNNNYISEPEMETNYIDVPYRNGLLDASTAITGRPIWKTRELSFVLGVKAKDKLDLDVAISNLRNLLNGRICQITLDNDLDYYWRGRVFIIDFDRFQKLGQFVLSVPKAEPYKYKRELTTIKKSISSSGSIVVLPGTMPAVPTFKVTNLIGNSITMAYKGTNYSLVSGTNKFPEVIVNDIETITLTFSGSATIEMTYREGSL